MCSAGASTPLGAHIASVPPLLFIRLLLLVSPLPLLLLFHHPLSLRPLPLLRLPFLLLLSLRLALLTLQPQLFLQAEQSSKWKAEGSAKLSAKKWDAG